MKNIYLFGEIGYEITAITVRDQLEGIEPGSEIVVNIHSNGGSVFEGFAIASLLSSYKTTACVHGLAASMASYIALKCDSLEMAEGSQLMVHNPSSFAYGNAEDLKGQAELLDSIKSDMLDLYKSKLGDDAEKMLDSETWITAKQAIEMGIAKSSERKEVACFDLAVARASGTEKFGKEIHRTVAKYMNELAEAKIALDEKQISIEAQIEEIDLLKSALVDAEKEKKDALNRAETLAKSLSVAPVATQETNEPKTILEQYRSLSGMERTEFFAKNQKEILRLLKR